MVELINRAKNKLSAEPNLLRIEGKVVIVGDIHGQFYDLIWMIQKTKSKYGDNCKVLFLGDYVDRGLYGVEVMAYLMAIKLKNLDTVYLLRGNHETREMTTFYNFRDQCLKAYDEEVYELYSDLFEALPIAAVVNNTFLAVHGGISPKLTHLELINEIDRKVEPQADELLMDLLWSDPMKRSQAKNKEFSMNSNRGVSCTFGYAPLKKLLKQENLTSLVRAHEMQQRGFKFHNWGQPNEEPTCITIFSAPNYCQSTNEAAIMSVNENKQIDVLTFEETAAKPYALASG